MAYGLIFDVDGVVADTESLIAEATIRHYRDTHGIELTPEDFHPYVGAGDIKFTSGPAKERGLEIDIEATVKACHANFYELLSERSDIEYPGVRALIDAAAVDSDWRVALATSSPKKKSEATLGATGIDTSKFDAWIAGDMIKRPKPNAEIYVTAALAMRLPPTSCVAIEDAPNGIKAAKDACMKCVGVTNTFPASALEGADRIVDTLDGVDLDALLELLNEDKDARITWGARIKR